MDHPDARPRIDALTRQAMLRDHPNEGSACVAADAMPAARATAATSAVQAATPRTRRCSALWCRSEGAPIVDNATTGASGDRRGDRRPTRRLSRRTDRSRRAADAALAADAAISYGSCHVDTGTGLLI
jgi:hypothetical protein